MKRNIHDQSNVTKKVKDVQVIKQPISSSSTASRDDKSMVELTINSYCLNVEELYKKHLYKMSVRYTPETLPEKLYRSALIQFNEKHYPSVTFAYDGRFTMYTTKQLLEVSGLIHVYDKKRDKYVSILIQTSLTCVIDMSQIKNYLRNGLSSTIPEESVKALKIVLDTQKFGLTNRYSDGLGTFNYNPFISSSKIDFEQLKKYFINGWTPFISEYQVQPQLYTKNRTLISVLQEEMKVDVNNEMDSKTFDLLQRSVKNMKIRYRQPGLGNYVRDYKIYGLYISANTYNMVLDDSRSCNVVEYFQKVRNYKVRYPFMPCYFAGKNRLLIPIELGIINTELITLKHSPKDNIGLMGNASVNTDLIQNPAMQEFGIYIENRVASVPARVLEEPTLVYGRDLESKPAFGTWKLRPLVESVVLKDWAILNFDEKTDMHQLRDLEKTFVERSQELNMSIGPAKGFSSFSLLKSKSFEQTKSWISNAINNFKKDNIKLIVVIFKDECQRLYDTIKQIAELDVGIMTQCLKSSTLKKFIDNPRRIRNILLKINSKMDGVNHKLSPLGNTLSISSIKGSMIMGGFVAQTPLEKSTNLVEAAVASSYDLEASRFSMQWRVQPRSKSTHIEDLESITHQFLIKFMECTGCVPAKIIFYRDGLSQSQQKLCPGKEMEALRRGCMRVHVGYRPPTTYVMLQKNTKLRIGPKDDGTDGSIYEAMPNGTVLNSKMIDAFDGRKQFYLTSKLGKKTSSLPNKYEVVWDDSNFSEEQIEKITFDLCFLTINDTQSTSYPAPVNYARLAATRARLYHKNAYYSGHGQEAINGTDVQTLNVSTMTGQPPMFFV